MQTLDCHYTASAPASAGHVNLMPRPPGSLGPFSRAMMGASPERPADPVPTKGAIRISSMKSVSVAPPVRAAKTKVSLA